MRFPRKSGILLHISSLPSKYGIGDMGDEAREFIDFLLKSKQGLWQVLPLNPVDEYNSPYKSPSVFAGNTMFISPELLLEDGYLLPEDLQNVPEFSDKRVDFPGVGKFKEAIFRKAFNKFKHMMDFGEKSLKEDFEYFVSSSEFWIDDFALYVSLSKMLEARDWTSWSRHLTGREENKLSEYRDKLKEEIFYEKFLQYIFHKQWDELKKYANERGIRIIGDIPIYTDLESADVWCHQELFKLDSKGIPVTVAGVPPDYFSKTGQLWENPVYRWDEMAKDGYFWWRKRLENTLEKFDIIRLDHFRGFEAYWEVSYGEETAINGSWSKGPGYDFFSSLKDCLGEMHVIAEDLGHITEEVHELRNRLGYPGMKILQFENLDDFEDDAFLQNIDSNTVFYTGTHDNDTLYGWYKKEYGEAEEGYEVALNECRILIEKLFKCSADMVVMPVQDLLLMDSSERMNLPGTKHGNWAWRLSRSQFENDLVKGQTEALAEMTIDCKRN
ncbi:4-alpha-glucanotransferase [Dethiosulfatibacter aminovorans DSM 17477]|uniref:4-alpha-glucanotransferase n=1 Tax=Dethiosulfatibacter aminovorans DSM 17477 TaxID=1121476 RepID=A0A1M6FVH0_9FIRM|nr:4-alpha-glucanotransferase [Dethiosulfatibacter aminovorans]SHJ01642.1 4-alpha-glucanotransferase [Dethiosulfatibacter aminovorans DSM 17477]